MSEEKKHGKRNKNLPKIRFKKIWKDQSAAAAVTIVLIVIIAIISVALVAAYALGDEGYGHGNKTTASGYVVISVDLRGAAPLGDDTYFKIENNEGTTPITAQITAGKTSLSLFEFFSELGLFSTQVDLKLVVTLASTPGMAFDYEETDSSELSWTLTNGALTAYRSESTEPFYLEDEGTYTVTAKIYKTESGDGVDWELQDTCTISLLVKFSG